eukprot:323709-Chlamydomonas_euryale.AAC.1
MSGLEPLQRTMVREDLEKELFQVTTSFGEGMAFLFTWMPALLNIIHFLTLAILVGLPFCNRTAPAPTPTPEASATTVAGRRSRPSSRPRSHMRA